MVSPSGGARPPGGTVRLAVAGFGRLAQNYYVPALRRMADVATVVAVADPAAACREAAGRLIPGVRGFESQVAMLDAVGGIDGLLVASPPAAHLAAWNHAAAAPGAPAVFMEKPFVRPGELPSVHASPDATRRLMVNFNRRFWPRYRQLAHAVRAGAIGRVVSAELELQVDVTRWLSVTQHRVEPGQGGALYDLGSQMIDLAGVVVGGRPVAVRVTARSVRWEADHLEVALAFAEGAGGDVRCRLAYDTPTRERILVRGTAGQARIDNPNTALHVSTGAGATLGVLGRGRDLATFAGHAARRHTSMSRMTIELALRSFVDGVRARAESFTPGFDDAVFNARALEAARRSLENGGNEEPIPAQTATTEGLT